MTPHVLTIVNGVTISITFMVLDLPVENPFHVILRRSWLWDSRTTHNWATNVIVVRHHDQMINTLIKGNVPVTTIKQVQNMTLDVFMAKIMANEELFLNDLYANCGVHNNKHINGNTFVGNKKKWCAITFPYHDESNSERAGIPPPPHTQTLEQGVITCWSSPPKDNSELVNLSSQDNPKYIKINSKAPLVVQTIFF